MTSSTTRNTSPAATRTGRGGAALPHDPGLDAILADPALGPTAKLIAKTLDLENMKNVGELRPLLQRA